MKKVLSMVLVIAMVLSSFSFAFAAVELTDIEGSDNQKAIETLVALGIINGYEDGTFREDNTITRGELAKVLVIALGYGNLVGGASSDFSDMKDPAVAWADGYVALAAGRNIVNGYPDGTFKANQTVTFDEAITMIVRALGYTDDCNELRTMSWPTNYKVKAAELNLTKDVVINATGADRGSVAQLLYNALTAPLVTVNADGDVTPIINTADSSTTYVNETLLSRLANRRGATEGTAVTITPAMLDPESKDYAGDIVDLLPYLYQEVEVYYDKNYEDGYTRIIHVARSYSETYTGTFKANNPAGDYATNDKVNIKLADGSTKTLKLHGTYEEYALYSYEYSVYFNGEEEFYNETEMEKGTTELTSLVDANVTVVAEDGYLYNIVATKATFGDRVAREYKEGDVKLGRINLPVNDDKDVDLTKVAVIGAVDAIEDIVEDDVVIAYASRGCTNDNITNNIVVLVVVRDTFEGKITRTNLTEKTIHVDDEKCSLSGIAGAEFAALSVGNEGVFYKDDAGKVFAFEETLDKAKDYAVIIEGYNGVALEKIIRFKPEIKLINEAGEKVTYVVNADAKIEDPKTGEKVDDLVKKDTDGLKTVLNLDLENIPGTLIKFKLNENNEIKSIAIIPDKADETIDDTTAKSFAMANGGTIFNIKNGDTSSASNFSVVKVENLPKEITMVNYDTNTDGEYNALVSTDAVKATSNFALITASEYVLNSDDEKVYEVTYYKDGEKVVSNSKKHSDVTITGITNGTTANVAMSKVVNKGFIVELTLSSGKITAIAQVESLIAPSAATTDNLILVEGTYKMSDQIYQAKNARLFLYSVNEENGEAIIDKEYLNEIALNDEVAVYIVDKDNEFVSVGTLEDLRGATLVNMYDTVNKDGEPGADGKVDIIIIK